MEDWYRLTHNDLKRNHGAGLAQGYWRASAIEGVKECFPQFEWHEWLFSTAPIGFWKERRNRFRYMNWLGKQLGYRRPDDWYAATVDDFNKHKGRAMLTGYYGDSPSSAVIALFPSHRWQKWRFHRAPLGFWQKAKNRHRYLRWLAEEIGRPRPEDWYAVRIEDFVSHFGRECVKFYSNSPASAAMDLFPDHAWEEWRFQRVPTGFWHQAENRRRYMQWLGRQLGYCQIEDWRRVRKSDFTAHYGGGLLALFRSYRNLLRDSWPEIDWGDACQPSGIAPKALPVGRRGPQKESLAIAQILQWADAHRRRTRRWPTAKSGLVTGKGLLTWLAISAALQQGLRGLPGGSSLPRLLAQHRGVRNNKGLPPLRIQEILRWADEHHQRTRTWPTAKSDLVAGTVQQTWRAIDTALRHGLRGLPRGSSLLQLLAQHRGVRNNRSLPPLCIQEILRWADEHHRRTGTWPTTRSGLVAATVQLTWCSIDIALRDGRRGLPGGTSLFHLLVEHRNLEKSGRHRGHAPGTSARSGDGEC